MVRFEGVMKSSSIDAVCAQNVTNDMNFKKE